LLRISKVFDKSKLAGKGGKEYDTASDRINGIIKRLLLIAFVYLSYSGYVWRRQDGLTSNDILRLVQVLVADVVAPTKDDEGNEGSASNDRTNNDNPGEFPLHPIF
jgi:hypothetical protein